jgi:hypothetical protein
MQVTNKQERKKSLVRLSVKKEISLALICSGYVFSKACEGLRARSVLNNIKTISTSCTLGVSTLCKEARCPFVFSKSVNLTTFWGADMTECQLADANWSLDKQRELDVWDSGEGRWTRTRQTLLPRAPKFDFCSSSCTF